MCDLHVAILGEMDHSIGTLSHCEVVVIPRETILDLTTHYPTINRAFWWTRQPCASGWSLSTNFVLIIRSFHSCDGELGDTIFWSIGNWHARWGRLGLTSWCAEATTISHRGGQHIGRGAEGFHSCYGSRVQRQTSEVVELS